MDNIAFLDNPYSEGVIVPTRGVAYDAKAAKLNNTTKKPYVLKHWKDKRPNSFRLADPNTRLEVTAEPASTTKDYAPLLDSLNMTTVEHDKEVDNSGAKKLRVNRIVIGNSGKVYRSSKKASVQIKQPQVTPEEEVVNLINQINVVEAPVEAKKEEVPLNEVHENTRNEFTPSAPVMSSRTQRNAQEYESVAREESPKQEPKATDMDLYNNLIHSNSNKEDEVSRQLQGAKEKLAIETKECRKLEAEYAESLRLREELKRSIANKKREQEEKNKEELAKTLNNIETVEEEKFARTRDLADIRREIEELKRIQESMESDNYSLGRHVA